MLAREVREAIAAVAPINASDTGRLQNDISLQ